VWAAGVKTHAANETTLTKRIATESGGD